VVVAFVRSKAELATVAVPAIDAARRDKLAWIAYPKAGKLGTDLNRDLLSASVPPNLITARSGADQPLAAKSQVHHREAWAPASRLAFSYCYQAESIVSNHVRHRRRYAGA
jgi:hypothetical protein